MVMMMMMMMMMMMKRACGLPLMMITVLKRCASLWLSCCYASTVLVRDVQHCIWLGYAMAMTYGAMQCPVLTQCAQCSTKSDYKCSGMCGTDTVSSAPQAIPRRHQRDAPPAPRALGTTTPSLPSHSPMHAPLMS
eukprot:2858417-Rhodomonas_salina.2